VAREIIRVEKRKQRIGTITAVKLQSKGHYDYIIKSRALKPDQLKVIVKNVSMLA
jgi:hypothetical protein